MHSVCTTVYGVAVSKSTSVLRAPVTTAMLQLFLTPGRQARLKCFVSQSLFCVPDAHACIRPPSHSRRALSPSLSHPGLTAPSGAQVPPDAALLRRYFPAQLPLHILGACTNCPVRARRRTPGRRKTTADVRQPPPALAAHPADVASTSRFLRLPLVAAPPAIHRCFQTGPCRPRPSPATAQHPSHPPMSLRLHWLQLPPLAGFPAQDDEPSPASCTPPHSRWPPLLPWPCSRGGPCQRQSRGATAPSNFIVCSLAIDPWPN